MKLGTAIRMVRSVRGLQLQELAEKTGISHGYMCKLEADQRTPSMEVVESLCTALKIPVTFLFLFAEGDDELVNFHPLAWAEVFRRAA